MSEISGSDVMTSVWYQAARYINEFKNIFPFKFLFGSRRGNEDKEKLFQEVSNIYIEGERISLSFCFYSYFSLTIFHIAGKETVKNSKSSLSIIYNVYRYIIFNES